VWLIVHELSFYVSAKKRKAANNKIVKYKEFTKKVFFFLAIVTAKEQKRHNSYILFQNITFMFF